MLKYSEENLDGKIQMIIISDSKKHAKACISKSTKKKYHENRFLCWHGFRIEMSEFIRDKF